MLLFIATIEGGLIYYQSFPSPFKCLDKNIREDESAIFIISQVDTLCRPIIQHKEILTQKNRVLFVFQPDFTDEDIENFRNAFQIPKEVPAERMNKAWQKVLDSLQKKMKNRDAKLFNYYIDISKGKINNIEAF